MSQTIRMESTYSNGDQICVTLWVTDCASCGVIYAFPQSMEKRRREDGAGWWCPNGHSQVFLTTELHKLQRELGAVKADRTFYEEENKRLQGSLSATRGQLTRAKNRAAAGVCQDCNRTFQNVARHMQTKHGAKNEGMVGRPPSAGARL